MRRILAFCLVWLGLGHQVFAESTDTKHTNSESLETESGIPEDLDGVELYDWLAYEGIFDSEIKNHVIHELIEEGIHHADIDIRMATISGIWWYSWSNVSFIKWQAGVPDLERRLEIVPGLRQFLLNFYEDGKRRFADDRPSPSEVSPSSWKSIGFTERNGKLAMTEETAWEHLPAILVRLFPRDLEVLDIVWEASTNSQVEGSNEPPCGYLAMLNGGYYATEEANALRIQCLMSNQEVFEATKGLAVCQTDTGFDALVEWLDVPNENLRRYFPHVMEAMVAYGKRALPFAEKFATIAQGLDLLPNSGESVERPSGFNFFPYHGEKYRVYQSLQRLKRLEQRYSETSISSEDSSQSQLQSENEKLE